ncbi:MAG: hypothetical protein ACREC5_00445 [Thermoplasmata archaeon]
MPEASFPVAPESLVGIRRGGAITELLFLYECITARPTRLRPIADRLGLTVQAASHCFRQLRARGLVELVGGQYRPTLRGVEWLHRMLGGLREEIDGRLAALHIVRSTRAVAAGPIPPGSEVSLSMEEGMLTARPGPGGPSRGRARTAAAAGGLVEIDELQGIVPIAAGPIHILTIEPGEAEAPRTVAALRERVRRRPGGLWAAQGLEAYHCLRRAMGGPVARFAVAAAGREASQLGVPTTVVSTTRDLPRLLEELRGGELPPLQVTALLPLAAPRRGHRKSPTRSPFIAPRPVGSPPPGDGRARHPAA